MARMGHDDMRAALIYQRATSEADRRIADGSVRSSTAAPRQTVPDDGPMTTGRPDWRTGAGCGEWPVNRTALFEGSARRRPSSDVDIV